MNENETKVVPAGAPAGQLNGVDLKSIAIGAGMAVAGALLTYVSSVITQIDFGAYTPLVVSLWSIVANAVRIWISDKSKNTA